MSEARKGEWARGRRLMLTDTELLTLNGILGGAIARFNDELRKINATDHEAAERTAFYTDWRRRTEALRDLVTPLMGDDDNEEEDSYS